MKAAHGGGGEAGGWGQWQGAGAETIVVEPIGRGPIAGVEWRRAVVGRGTNGRGRWQVGRAWGRAQTDGRSRWWDRWEGVIVAATKLSL